jgi:hypothetical protein
MNFEQKESVYDDLEQLDQRIKNLESQIDNLDLDELGEEKFDAMEALLSLNFATLVEERQYFLAYYKEHYGIDFDT